VGGCDAAFTNTTQLLSLEEGLNKAFKTYFAAYHHDFSSLTIQNKQLKNICFCKSKGRLIAVCNQARCFSFCQILVSKRLCTLS
jgi:CRISPR/Cas system CMR-associated protein Cmr5 small subunit